MNYKEELIKRVKFLLENDMYLIEPIDKSNLVNMYMNLEDNNDYLLRNIELLLLSDKKIEENALYNIVLSRKNSKEYLNELKSKPENVMDYFTILSIIRKFIIRSNVKDEYLLKKLDVLDEYFRIVRYQNNPFTYISGAELLPTDIKNHIKIQSGIIKNGIHKEEKVNYSSLSYSQFIEYVSNMDNHHQDNLSILTEEEKKEIYLAFHDEIPWDTKQKCTKSNLYFSDSFCNSEFYLKEENIFYYRNNFYMMCPYCYNLVIINQELIPETIKKRIRKKTENNFYYLRNVYCKREALVYEKDKELVKKLNI